MAYVPPLASMRFAIEQVLQAPLDWQQCPLLASADADLAGEVLLQAGRLATDILAPLNAKLGTPCFVPGASAGDEVRVRFDARCNDPAVLSRLETNPPAGLYGAPPVRQKAIIRDPETLKKLSA